MNEKQFIALIFAILLIFVGCNNHVNQQSPDTSVNDNPSNIDKQVEELHNNGIEQSDGIKQNSAVDNEKQVWLIYYNLTFNFRMMFNITNFPNEKINSLSFKKYLENTINDETLLEEIKNEDYDISMTPSSEYLIIKLPFEYTKYLNYNIVPSAQDLFPNIQNYLNSSHRLGYTGPTYSVVYSIKQQKIVSLDEVDNGNDKESIYDWILDPHYFYISSLNTIKHVDNVGDYDYRHLKYHNYKEDKIILYIPSTEDHKKVDIIFYDLVKGEEADHIEITDKDKIEYAYFTQWNEDGTVYFTVNYTSYKYNLKTKKLITLGINIYFPVITPDGKYLIYSERGPDMLFSFEHMPNISEQIKPGMYAKNLETGEVIFVDDPDVWGCEGIKIMTINKN